MRTRAVQLVKLMIIMLVVYALLRFAFLVIYFPHENWSFRQAINLFYRGFRMDFAALFYLNLPFLLYYFFIDPMLKVEWKSRVAVGLFSLLNLPFIALNFVDLVYYQFNHRRSTIDLLDVFADSSSAFGVFFKNYWYVLLVFILVCFAVVHRANQILRPVGVRKSSLVAYISFSLLVLLMAGWFARGFAKRPIFPSTALLYFDARLQPLVNNSTFNFLYSVLRKQTVLEPKNYFTATQLDSLVPIHHQYQHQAAFQKRNLVFFVLESFSKEFFKGGSEQAYMPFFDSLMQHSTVFNNAYANALESNKALPAILASLPDIMDEPIYLSNYSNIPFKGIGHILKEEGYRTSFFMGAEYDHFGFGRLCKMVGIDDYYSGDSYGKHRNEHDGTWGIYDEYFFRYFARVISQQKQPFFSVLFNLSSHAPYKIPDHAARNIHVPGQAPHQDSKTYVDDCFRQLFASISRQPWFNNTIFVFVADHGFRFTTDRNEMVREMRIPLFVYDPQQPQHHSEDKMVKQLDIIPSVLDKLNYSKPFTAFGTSFYRSGPGFSVNRLNGLFQYIDSTHFIGYDDINERLVFHYRYRQDSLLQNNLINTTKKEAGQQVAPLKAILQREYNSLVKNKLE